MTAIDINHIFKCYLTGIKRKRKEAVADLSLQVKHGEIFGIIGVNGAGKSTVLKMILGFVRPDSGRISIMGLPPSDPQSRKHIGYLPENPYFYDHLSGKELLNFGASSFRMDKVLAEQRMTMLLERVNLLTAKNQRLRFYSKGMTQRAGLCYALVHDPQIVILDEPMSGLDPLGRKMVIDLILDLKKSGKTVLFCSHILSDVERVCDRVAIMDKGRLQTVLTHADLEEKKNTSEIILEGLPERLSDHLIHMGCNIKPVQEKTVIECPNDRVALALSEIHNHHVNVIHLDTSVNPIEKIFLETLEPTP